jgi:hypothetical protein
MGLLRIALVLAAGAAVAGQYLQERYRLARLATMPGHLARDSYETRRRRSERTMAVVTALLALVGLAAIGDLVLAGLAR